MQPKLSLRKHSGEDYTLERSPNLSRKQFAYLSTDLCDQNNNCLHEGDEFAKFSQHLSILTYLPLVISFNTTYAHHTTFAYYHKKIHSL